jgi:hypothetical protein
VWLHNSSYFVAIIQFTFCSRSSLYYLMLALSIKRNGRTEICSEFWDELKSSLWGTALHSAIKNNLTSRSNMSPASSGSACFVLHFCLNYFRLWRWRWYIYPKLQLTIAELRVVIFHKIYFQTVTFLVTSDPTIHTVSSEIPKFWSTSD